MPIPQAAPSAVPVLETSRLRLRGFRADDFDTWFAISRHIDYHRYFTPEPMPAEEVWKLLLRSAGHWAVMGFGFWAVEEKASGRFVGGIGFLNLKRDIDPPLGDAPEMGWVLDPGIHGRGRDDDEQQRLGPPLAIIGAQHGHAGRVDEVVAVKCRAGRQAIIAVHLGKLREARV